MSLQCSGCLLDFTLKEAGKDRGKSEQKGILRPCLRTAEEGKKAVTSVSRVSISQHSSKLCTSLTPDSYVDRSGFAIDHLKEGKSDSILAFELQQSLTERLAALGPNADLKSRFLLYQETFTAIVSMRTSLSALLQKVQSGYEEVTSAYFRSMKLPESTAILQPNKDFAETLSRCEAEISELRATVFRLRRETQTHLIRIAELTALSASKDKKLREVASGYTRSRQNPLSEMVKALQSEVQSLKSRDSLVRSASKHKKSLSSCTPCWRATRFESQQTVGTISPIANDLDGFFWDGSGVEDRHTDSQKHAQL